MASTDTKIVYLVHKQRYINKGATRNINSISIVAEEDRQSAMICSTVPWTINVTDGKVGRTTSAPNSALRLIVDKDQGLRSGILS